MKRTPANSIDGAIAAMANAQKPALQPPSYCDFREGDQPFWDAIIDARARDEWLEADLVLACQLARCMHDIEDASRRERDEGRVIENSRGSLMLNPIIEAQDILIRREVMLMVKLRMAGRVLGPVDKQALRRKVERDAKAAAKEIEGETLID